MTGNEYQALAMRTAGSESNSALLINGVLGLNGESGEVADIIKKHFYQGHALDREHLAEELGDVAWYLAVTAQAIGYDLDDVLAINIAKLKKRYPDGFEADRSINREKYDGRQD